MMRTDIRLIGDIAALIGFAGSVAGMSAICSAVVRPESPTPHDLIRGVMTALVFTLALILFVLVPLAAWAHHRQR